jgi:hypothetical protein
MQQQLETFELDRCRIYKTAQAGCPDISVIFLRLSIEFTG